MKQRVRVCIGPRLLGNRRPRERDHLAECAGAGLLGRFDINELFGDFQLAVRSIRSQQIELRRNREAIGLLVFRRDAGVYNGAAEHGLVLRIAHG